MDKYRADAHESKPFEKINPKSTPFFGQFEKKNPLLQNNVSTTSFDPMNYEKMKPNQSQNMSKIEKNQNYNYYMDTPSKKKEQENILTSYNKPKLNEKEISSFSTGAFSAFKKFGIL